MINPKFILICALIAGCTHQAPSELVDARVAYHRASMGAAAQVVPAELHKAEVALADAEASFKSSPKGYATKDLAYVARRKAQLAESLAKTKLAAKEKTEAEQRFTVKQGEVLDATRAALAASEKSAAITETKLSAAEQAARDADRTRDAALAALAATKEDARGLVITLSGSVLFASDKAELLSEAQRRLGQVAEALMTTKARSLVVEGYTDSQGDDAHNLQLSQRRAEAVRTYLISRGYDAKLITARGFGEAAPIASNDSAEGRANNRRVEIVVGRALAAN